MIFCGDILVRYWKLKLSLKVKGAICYFRPFHRILYFTQWLPNWQGRLRQMRRSGCVWKGPNLMPAGSINCLKSESRSLMGFRGEPALVLQQRILNSEWRSHFVPNFIYFHSKPNGRNRQVCLIRKSLAQNIVNNSEQLYVSFDTCL